MNPIQNNIIDILDLDSLPKEEAEEILIRTGALIYQNVLMRAVEEMTEKDQDDFEKMLDNEAEAQDIFSFLKNRVKDFEKIILEETEKFKNKTSRIMDQIGN